MSRCIFIQWFILQGPLPITCRGRCVGEEVQQWWCVWNVLCCIICKPIQQHHPYYHPRKAHACAAEWEDFHPDEVYGTAGWNFKDWSSTSCKFEFLDMNIYFSAKWTRSQNVLTTHVAKHFKVVVFHLFSPIHLDSFKKQDNKITIYLWVYKEKKS